MKIYFITSNEGKYKEVVEKLKYIPDIEIEQLERSYPEIQAESLNDVAEFGLKWLQDHIDSKYLDDSIMIEDSGLFVKRLKGFPGVYSSYVHKTIGGYKAILTLMEGEWERNARFETCIGFIRGGDEPKFFFGSCDGTLSTDARGEHGFGYDPIFIPEGDERTFAEMKPGEKNIYSHRGRALEKLKEYLRNFI